jgi:peptidoglycan/xylan/chitin deacetylase (PgdA/CDA1 family)
VPLTLFVITRDLRRASNADVLKAFAQSGHELANHTRDHFYDVSRRTRAEQMEQVQAGIASLAVLTGTTPQGFRAPGYTITDQLFDVLVECGVRYDSSVFPCPPYYGAKLAVRTRMRLKGQVSRSIVDSPRVLRAPTEPYRIGKPYWRRGAGILELPIQVATPLRLPFIGTTLSLLGPAAARLLTRSLVGQEFINLELHGIDFLDQHDGLESLAAHQPDLRVPIKRKLETFSAVIDELRQHGYKFVRLDEAARIFSERLASG